MLVRLFRRVPACLVVSLLVCEFRLPCPIVCVSLCRCVCVCVVGSVAVCWPLCAFGYFPFKYVFVSLLSGEFICVGVITLVHLFSMYLCERLCASVRLPAWLAACLHVCV